MNEPKSRHSQRRIIELVAVAALLMSCVGVWGAQALFKPWLPAGWGHGGVVYYLLLCFVILFAAGMVIVRIIQHRRDARN